MLDGFTEEEFDILEKLFDRMKENLRDAAPQDKLQPKGERGF